MKRIILIMGMCAMLGAGVYAQEQAEPARPENPEGISKMREMIKTVRIWKMTEELQLTEEQCYKIFPMMAKAEDEKKELKKKNKEIIDELRTIIGKKDANQKQIKDTIERLKKNTEEIRKKKEQTRDSIEKELTPEQQARYILFISDFHKKMTDMATHAKKMKQEQGLKGEGLRERMQERMRMQKKRR